MNKQAVSPVSILVTAIVPLLAALWSTSALAEGLGNPKQFSVEMKMTAVAGEDAGLSMNMKFYVGDNQLRAEVIMEGSQEGGVHITKYDGNTVTSYMLIPQMKMYMKTMGGSGEMEDEEGPILIFGLPDDASHPCKSDPQTTCTKTGSGSHLGRDVDKYTVTDIEDGVQNKSTIWFDRELLFPVKVEDSEGVMEAVSIDIGKQPAELFEIPANYREMSM